MDEQEEIESVQQDEEEETEAAPHDERVESESVQSGEQEASPRPSIASVIRVFYNIWPSLVRKYEVDDVPDNRLRMRSVIPTFTFATMQLSKGRTNTPLSLPRQRTLYFVLQSTCLTLHVLG